tara:strand:+ start:212 stop:451 length:240 start_codon:yes stop_codon:yes gene_type:complete
MTQAIHSIHRPASRTPHLLDETEESFLAAWRRGSLSARQFWKCYCRIPDSLNCDQLGFTDAEVDLLVDIIVEDITKRSA